jgi:peroxiredoxin
MAAPANPTGSDPLLRVPEGGDPSIQAPLRSTPTSEADKQPEAPRDWRLVSGRSWQIVSAPGEAPEVTDLAEGTRGICPAGMVEVRGKMKISYVLDELQQQACTRWISRTFPERCADFDREKWLALSKDLPTSDMHFCIDRFEYPNRKGENPVIMVSWYEAKASCESAGKRLCSENEWTFACEGEEAMPYPYGYTRDANACVIDRPWKKYDDVALSARTTDAAKNELDRLWQGAPSGSHPRCKSPFGVYDMTGNVDEWTRSSIPGERPSVLKGGYWGPVRTRCRPATKAHGETHTFYQQGFRCCADAK